MARTRDPRDLLPLTPALFQVLIALADGEQHGYAILKDIEQRTEGAVRLSTGTLYGIIKRLLTEGLIAERSTPSPPGHDERRRSYRLTPFGRAVALAETERLERDAALARATRALRLRHT